MPLYLDNFTNTSGTNLSTHISDTGNSYSGDTSFWQIQNNRLVIASEPPVSVQPVGLGTLTQFDITLDAQVLTGSGIFSVMVCGTTDANGNGYLIQFLPTYVRIVKESAGTELHNSTAYDTVTDGEAYHKYKLEVRNDGLTLYSGVSSPDTLRWTSADTDYRGSGIFLKGFGPSNATNGIHLNSITIDEYPPATIVDIPTGTISLTGSSTTVGVASNLTVEVPVGSIITSGLGSSATVISVVTVEVPVASVNLTAFSPTVLTTRDEVIVVPTGNISVTSYAPNISGQLLPPSVFGHVFTYTYQLDT